MLSSESEPIVIQLSSVDELFNIENRLKDDPRSVQVLNLVRLQLEKVSTFLKTNNAGSPNVADGMCLEVSRFFNNVLKEAGFEPVVLQGEIELSKDDWLEHHLSLIRLPMNWITVDFAASSIPPYGGTPFLILICEPENSSLKAALKQAYKWWTPRD